MKSLCFSFLICLFSIFKIESQIVNNNAFLKGNFVEVGIAPNGSFGSITNAPSGYHARTNTNSDCYLPGSTTKFSSTNFLGFVADYQRNGWATGSPFYIGDYFLPGYPQEGYSVQINNTKYNCWRSNYIVPSNTGYTVGASISSVPSGGQVSLSTTGNKVKSIWVGNFGTLKVTQTTILDITKLYFTVYVDMENTGSSGIDSLFYQRTVDPDNMVMTGGNYNTNNSITSILPNAKNEVLLSCISNHNGDTSYLGLGTRDCRAKPFICNSSLYSNTRLDSIYRENDGNILYTGSKNQADIGLGIVYRMGNLPAGATASIAYAYILNKTDLSEALESTQPSVLYNNNVIDNNTFHSACTNPNISLKIENHQGYTWSWQANYSGVLSATNGIQTTVNAASFDTIKVNAFGIKSLCDTLKYQINFVNKKYFIIKNDTLCQGDSVLFAQSYRKTSGLYLDSFKSIYGCDSLKGLSLIVLQPYFTINDTICQGSSKYRYTSSGTYQDTFRLAKCIGVRTLNLQIHPSSTKVINKTICKWESYLGRAVTGNYIDTLKNQNMYGCDSIRKLNLTVLETSGSFLEKRICAGDSFWGRKVTGNYKDTLMNSAGCDSFRSLALTVLNKRIDSIFRTICEGDSFMGKSSEGIYSFYNKSIEGCDSNQVLFLNVNKKTFGTVNAIICEGDSFLGRKTTGTYIDTILNKNLCDSIRTLHLTVNPVTFSNTSATVCEGDAYWGYKTAGEHRDTFKNANRSGCDSIRILNLAIQVSSYSTTNKTICEFQSFWTRTTTGIYRDTLKGQSAAGCDSIRILNLTVIPKHYPLFNIVKCEGQHYNGKYVSGIYSDAFKNVNGCDSISHYNLTIVPKNYPSDIKTICDGTSYYGYRKTGVYIDTLRNLNGCDSIRKIILTVDPKPYKKINACLNPGKSILFYSQTIESPGVYIDSTQFGNRCDTIYELTVKQIVPFERTTTNYYCNQYHLDGIDFNYDQEISNTIYSKHGCDSIYEKQVFKIIRPNYSDTQIINFCDTFIFKNNIHFESKVFVDVYKSQRNKQCDSLYKTYWYQKVKRKKPIINLGVDSLYLIKGESIDLFVNRTLKHRWNTNDTFLRINVSPSHNTQYYVIASSNEGCLDTSYINIEVEDRVLLGLPSAFSPNGDNMNDLFGPNVNGNYKLLNFEIYNRIGEKVFKGSSQNLQWDGKFNGEVQPIGVYMYQIEYQANRQKYLKKGTLTLIR